MAGASGSDGQPEPEPRSAEPNADSDARRRPHLHHGARGHRAPRLQRPREREDAARRLRRPDDADGDGDLQRPRTPLLLRTSQSLEIVATDDWRLTTGD